MNLELQIFNANSLFGGRAALHHHRSRSLQIFLLLDIFPTINPHQLHCEKLILVKR